MNAVMPPGPKVSRDSPWLRKAPIFSSQVLKAMAGWPFAMVGSTRQWVTMMMKRFQKEGVLTVTPRHIRIERPAALLDMVSKRGT